MEYDLIIIGTGTAGMTAGLYAGRYLMKTLLIGDIEGGEGATAGITRNFPGFPNIEGYDLMMRMKEQVMQLGVEIKNDRVSSISRRGHCFTLTTASGDELIANTVIIAIGTRHRTLGLSREEEFKSKGVHYCVTCDGPLYKGKTVAFVGGGDSSVKGVNLMAEYASKIYFIVREKELNAEPINIRQMEALGNKVEVLYETEIKELMGKDKLEAIRLSKLHQGLDTISIASLFVEIGAEPINELPKQLGVELDDEGYVKVDNMMRTSIDGIFAAGDSTNHFGGFKQYITAAATGAVAATSAYNDHKLHGDLCHLHAIPHRVDSHSLVPQLQQ